MSRAKLITGHNFGQAGGICDSLSPRHGSPLQAWLPARTYVQEAIETRTGVDQSGEIIKLSHYCPWKEHLYELEQELSLPQQIKFCLYEVWGISPPDKMIATAARKAAQYACLPCHFHAVCIDSSGETQPGVLGE